MQTFDKKETTGLTPACYLPTCISLASLPTLDSKLPKKFLRSKLLSQDQITTLRVLDQENTGMRLKHKSDWAGWAEILHRALLDSVPKQVSGS